MPTLPNHLTAAHRAILERFRAGDRPLNRAIDAVLTENGRLDDRLSRLSDDLSGAQDDKREYRAEIERLRRELQAAFALNSRPSCDTIGYVRIERPGIRYPET
jgi:predicted RNase H-like nuclease (RuvC/YqgF family)